MSPDSFMNFINSSSTAKAIIPLTRLLPFVLTSNSYVMNVPTNPFGPHSTLASISDEPHPTAKSTTSCQNKNLFPHPFLFGINKQFTVNPQIIKCCNIENKYIKSLDFGQYLLSNLQFLQGANNTQILAIQENTTIAAGHAVF
jgi:hypothetical protein